MSSSGVSSSLVWLRPRRLFTKSITVGIRRAISAASCSGPLGRRWETPATSFTASSASSISPSSKGMGSICHRRSHSTPQPSPRATPPPPSPPTAPTPLAPAALRPGRPRARPLRLGEHVGEHAGVEGALVEGGLAPTVERRNYRRADVHEARGGPHVVAAGGVVPELDG